MNFSNAQGLPKALENMLTYSDYNSSGAKFDISATKLIDSPQIAGFWKEFGKDVTEDCADRLWSSAGSGIHSRLEIANASDADIICEKRFIGEEPHPVTGEPLKISAQLDVMDLTNNTIADLKTCSAWKLVMGEHSQWEAQLNVQAYLARKAGWQDDSVVIYALLRDWSKARVREDNYPNTPLQVVDIDLWSFEEQQQYVTERLALHFGDGEKQCTDAERWARPGSYAVMQKGKKRALRVLPTKEKALSWIASQGLADDSKVSIEHRPATYTRCESFCPFGKMGVCQQYREATGDE